MKIVFSTKNVSRSSFLDLCRFAYDYGFEGFEIYDAIKERASHHDSILRRDRIADSKRKLVNRGLSVSALRIPDGIESETITGIKLLGNSLSSEFIKSATSSVPFAPPEKPMLK